MVAVKPKLFLMQRGCCYSGDILKAYSQLPTKKMVTGPGSEKYLIMSLFGLLYEIKEIISFSVKLITLKMC